MRFFENKARIAAFCLVGILAILALGTTLRPNVKMDVAQNDQEKEAPSGMSEESVPEDVLPETSPEIPNEVPSDKHKDADERDRSAENQVLQNKVVASRIRATCKALDIQFPDDITTSKITQRPPFRESMFQFSTSLGDVLGFDPIDGSFSGLCDII